MNRDVIPEWTLDGLLDEASVVDRELKDRSLAFVLGAGASVSSGIPTAAHLAENWLAELHERACLDREESIDSWLVRGGSGIAGLAARSQAGTFYPQIFEQRFGSDPEAGYAALEDLMEGRWPSIGYSMLAEILHNTRHKVVVTTNFDNLVADALAMHGHKAPLVVAHESLTGFVRPQLRRPLVAKIHRDLLLHPKNDQRGVERLEAGWKLALRNLFKSYQPIVIGYGGNDGSLMGLLQSLERQDLAGPIWWCRQKNTPLPAAAQELLLKQRGISVEIPPFDEFMLRLAERIVEGLDLAGMSQRIERLGRARTERYRIGAERVADSLGREERADRIDCGRLARDGHHWWSWILRAMSKESNDKKDAAFVDAAARLASAWREPAEARDHAVAPMGSYPRVVARFAKVIALRGEDAGKESARTRFEEALHANPKDPWVIRDHAFFLEHYLGQIPEALLQYRAAYELDPVDDWNVSNYAICLDRNPAFAGGHPEAEELFDRALALAPDEVEHHFYKALFLTHHGRDDEAERQFRKALLLNPSDALTIRAFTQFLLRQDRGAEAEAIFKKAYASNQGNAAISGEFANFAGARGQYALAERLYEEAIDLAPPNDSQWLRGYANFLWISRHDSHTAEERYRELLKRDPRDPDTAANLASLLLARSAELGLEECIQWAATAVALCRPIARQACAEALLYQSIAADLKKEDPEPFLARLKWVLDKRYARVYWDFKPLEGVLANLGVKRRALYRKLERAILNEWEVRELDGEPIDPHRTWAQLHPVDPFAVPRTTPRPTHKPTRTGSAR